jgi:IS605 OrfB family transposase
MMKDQTRTYQTRPPLDPIAQKAFQACAELFAHVEHRLLADISKGEKPSELKSSYLVEYGITARQFNAIRVKVEGKLASIKELRKMQISDLKEQIAALETKISKLKKKPLLALLVHQKKRRLYKLQQRLEQLIKDQKEGKTLLCFGSKKLFHAQFDLEANHYKTHEEWLKAWRHARTSEIFFLGSKDEASGNQTCTATLEENNHLTLRIRLPDALHGRFGKYLILPHIVFSYGHQEIVTSLEDCTQRQLLTKVKDPNYINHGQALTFRFKRDEKGWRLFVSTSLPAPQWATHKDKGVIGVDINTDHLALVETDRFGNPLCKKTIPLILYGKTRQQSLALIGDACARVVDHAEQTLKPLILEDLDFRKKKQSLRETHSPSQSRKLSSFSYQAILTHLKSRAFSKKIEVRQVNPAFTSLIGRVKFATRYGLSTHHAAALCIGRRFLNLSEKVPRHLNKVPDGKGSHVALSLPVRNRGKHVWNQWRDLSKKVPAALAAHFRAKRSSSALKAALETQTLPDLVGATPICESLAVLLG